MESLSFFPMLDDALVQKTGPKFTPFSFYYREENGDRVELLAEDSASCVHPLTDEHGRWSPDVNGFGFSRTFTIRCASFLYGKNGVACKDAVLAVVLLWKSPDSRQRSSMEVGILNDLPTPQSFQIEKYFSTPCFKGRLDLQTAVVIKKAGNPDEDEGHLANIPGTVLGILDTFSVEFDGRGSSFPVMVVNDPGSLLWSVKCDFDDPLIDKFSDSVSINLNSAHRDFRFINATDKKNFNPSFLREVLAGALSTIVDTLRESIWWDDIKNGKGEEDSIAKAINYFDSGLELILDDPRQCSMAFREYFEKKLGEL